MGKAQVGRTLKVVLRGLEPSSATLRYQWYANGKAIRKATKASLTLTDALRGTKVRVKVTVTASAGRLFPR